MSSLDEKLQHTKENLEQLWRLILKDPIIYNFLIDKFSEHLEEKNSNRKVPYAN